MPKVIEGFIWAYSFKVYKSYYCYSWEAWQEAGVIAGTADSSGPTSWTTNREQRNKLEMVQMLELSKPTSNAR